MRKPEVLEEIQIILGPCEESQPIRPDSEALRSLGVDLEVIRERVEEAFGPGALERTRAWRRSSRLPLTRRSKKVLELALREALALGHRHLVPEHILLGILREGTGVACMILNKLAGSPGRVRRSVLDRFRQSA